MHSSAFSDSQEMDKTCRKHKEAKIAKCRTITSKAKIGYSLNVHYTIYRSILDWIDLLWGAACMENFDMIALTETWSDSSGKVFSPQVKIDGYTLFHMDRENRKGGGVAL